MDLSYDYWGSSLLPVDRTVFPDLFCAVGDLFCAGYYAVDKKKASILAPSLIKLGLPALTAHLFVFYFACLSAITPPVALAAYAGAGIAKTSPMTTAVEACKLGFAGFIVPFAFCYNSAMMMQGKVFEIISVFISAFIGVTVMSGGFQGWVMWKLRVAEKLIFIGAGLLMFVPGTATDIAGAAVAIGYLLISRKKWQKTSAAENL